MPKRTEPQRTVKSADRTLDLLDLVADQPYRLTFTDIAARLGIPKSSLSPLLRNLLARNYLELDTPRGSYGLGPRIAALAVASANSTPFGRVLHDAITELRDALNETVSYYEVRNDEVEIVDRVPTRHALAYTMAVGERAPLYAHSAGKIALSFMTDAEVDAYLERVPLKPLAPNTLRGRDALRRQIRAARDNGIAAAVEEFAAGIRGLAVPLAEDRRLVGVLNVAVPVSRFTPALDAAIREGLPRTAGKVAAAMGWH